MSWQDWGDVRKARGSAPTGKKHKKSDGWRDGGAVASDARVAKRNHERAIAEQKEAEQKARELAAVKARAKKARAEEKYKKKEAKRQAKQDRK